LNPRSPRRGRHSRNTWSVWRRLEDCLAALHSLLEKAIKAYEGRAPGLRHGIALDRHLTIILSQNETDRPHCAIYFNLFTPYNRKGALKAPSSPEGIA